MRAIGYARVSTNGQADNGESLDVQVGKIRAMAEVQGAELVDVIVDAGESARSLKRPGMGRVLDLVDSKAVAAVIVHKLDRLTRSVGDLADLLDTFDRRGVSLVSVSESLDTGTAAGRLVLNVMGSVAQWEREVIAERTREALASKKAKGQRVGTVPFGYQLAEDGSGLEPNKAEQRTLGAMKRLRAEGHSLRAIATKLNSKGHRTRRGSAWRHEYVANLLRSAV